MFKSTPWGLAIALCAAAVFTTSVEAALAAGAGKAGTSNKGTVSTTTTGQQQILAAIDPFGTFSFQLDYSFEAAKVQFQSLQGINGYVIDSFNLNPTAGLITDIRGHYDPFFNPDIDTPTFNSLEGPVNGAPTVIPPQQEIDIFQVLFLDLNPAVEKRFLVFAGDNNDFIQGMDALGNLIPNAVGPANVGSALLIIPGAAPNGVYPGISFPPGGGPGDPTVPLPAALPVGLVAGAGILARHRNRRRAA